MEHNPLQQIETTLHNLASPRRSHTFWGLMMLLVLATALIWLKHGDWLKAPGNYLLTESGDGFKNYATTIWHERYDSTFTHYGGMNYPFGEHVLFTDNQPVFSSAQQWWDRNMYDIDGRAAEALNLFQIISLLLGVAAMFLLLRKLHLAVWYAGLVALGIVFLSPQINRFDGHFGLSHTFIFPMLLYLLCRYEERQSRRYQSLQIGVLIWLAAQLHFYYFGLAALFLSLYMAYQVLVDRSWRNIRVRFSHWVVMILLPFALLNGWVHWSDFASDRPANPYGFTTYIGYWEGVFLPYEHFPLFQELDKLLTSWFNMPIRRVDYEARAYAGLVVFIYTLWLLFSGFRMFSKSWDTAAYHRTHKRYLIGIFSASFALLIFACGFPFAIKGMQWMVNYFGPLRQFRGLGRFTWAYYYIANTLVFYVLWNWAMRFRGIRGGKFPWLGKAVMGLALAVLIWEAWTMQRTQVLRLNPNIEKKEIAEKEYPWIGKVDFSPYQAILPLPYYHMGSENIWLEFDGGFFKKIQTTALHTGLPDMGVNLSRTSCQQTVKSVQLPLEPCETPMMLGELPDNRPLALVVEEGRYDEMRRKHQHLLNKARMVYDGPGVKILSLSLDSLRASVRESHRGVAGYVQSRGQHRIGRWMSPKPDTRFYYQSYDSLSATLKSFQGKGAYAGNMGDTTWLYHAPLPKGHHIISMWLHINQDLGMNHEMKIIENSLTDGREIHFSHEALRFHLRTVVGDWGLFELSFQVYEPDSRLRIFLQKQGVNQPYYLDELLIRPLDAELVRREPGWIIANNFWYREE